MKLSTVLLLVLAGTMITIVPAKSYADPQLDTLLSIAKQARDSLGITISQISNVPAQVNTLYEQGSNETDALAQAASQQDVASAKQHFLAAMNYFKETNDMINSLNTTAATNDQQKAEVNQLRGEIVRLENMGNLLKSIATQNNVDVNFTGFDGLLQGATRDLDAGNLTGTSGQIQSANEFIVATHSSLNKAAEERNSQMAKDFTERQIAQLNSSVSPNATVQNNSSAPNVGSPNGNGRVNEGKIGAPLNTAPNVTVQNNSNSAIYNNPREMVDKLKQLVSEGKVEQAISLIKAIQEYQKASLAHQSAERTAENQPPEVSHQPEQEGQYVVPHPMPVNNNTTTIPPPVSNIPPAPPVNNTVPTPPPVNNNTTTIPPPVNNTVPTPPPVNNNTTTIPPPVNNTVPTPPPVNNNTTTIPPPVSNIPPAPPVNNTVPTPPPVNNTVPTPPPVNNTVPTPPPANHTMPASPGRNSDHGKNQDQGHHSDHGQHPDHGKTQFSGQPGWNRYYQPGNGNTAGNRWDH